MMYDKKPYLVSNKLILFVYRLVSLSMLSDSKITSHQLFYIKLPGLPDLPTFFNGIRSFSVYLILSKVSHS